MTDTETTVEAGELPKVYVFANNKFGRDLACMSVGEDGHYFGSHISSSMVWARRDLTERPDRKAELETHFPGGYDVVILPEGEQPPDEVHRRFAEMQASEEQTT